MLEAKDLRIGNKILFSDDATIFEVVEIDKNGLHVKNDNEETWIELEHFEGIKLTEEILLRLGFEQRNGNENISQFGIGENPITRDWMLLIKYFKDENKFFFLNGFHTLKYLHELQNLYYSLTKQELTLKP